MSEAFDTFNINIFRVRHFVEIYKKQTKCRNTRGRTSTKETDILRSGVVFLHAAIEEYLRAVIFNIDMLKFKNGDGSVLRDVSLPLGDERPKRGEKFCVQELFAFREQSVEEILEKSIRDRVRFITFNNYQQICNELASVGVKIDGFADSKNLDDCIIRRHKIVHEADKNIRNSGKGNYRTSPINTNILQTWIDAEVSFIALVEEKIEAIKHDFAEKG